MDPFSMIPDSGGSLAPRPRRRRRRQQQAGAMQPIRGTGPQQPVDAQLNGFIMLEAAHVSFPDDATRVDVSGRGLRGVNADDMAFFTSVSFLDAGENSLALEAFRCLPSLHELRLHCNAISVIGDLSGAFPALRALDLSFNVLTPDAISALAALPALRDLDLSGNSLTAVPADMTGFASLESLSLENNQLDEEATMRALAACPALRRLSLARNYFRGVPATVAAAHARGGFPRLEHLDLSENYVSLEADLLGAALLPRLSSIDVHDNPVVDHAVLRARAQGLLLAVLGPAGTRPEQPAGAIPGLAEAARAAEEAAETAAADAARAAVHGSGPGAMAAVLAARGRLASGHSAVRHPDPIAATLLPELSSTVTEAALGQQRRPPAILCLPPPGSLSGAVEQRRQRKSAAYGRVGVARVQEPALPLTSEWREAGNARLASSHPSLFGGAQPTRQAADTAHQASPKRQPKPQAGLTAGGMFLTGGGADMGEEGDGEDGDDDAESVSSQQAAEEMLAAALAAKRHAPTAAPNPAKLRAAVNALRLALKQPLTKTSGEQKPAAHQRMTVAQIARQRPRVPYAPKRLTERMAAQRHRKAGATMANVQRVLDAMGERYANPENGNPASTVSPFELGHERAFPLSSPGPGYGGVRAESALDNEESMASLVDMVNKVMQEYDVDDDGDDERQAGRV